MVERFSGNRLPRGRSYARNDRVSGMVIGNRGVSAKVRGRRRQPYRVKVALKSFLKKEQQQILNAIEENPLILGELINQSLPRQIYELTRSIGIPLLPESWSSMKASCSCPDWAVPCKHIAAVIYLLANEIDKNPFVIFQLHNMDLIKYLAKERQIHFLKIDGPAQFPAEYFPEPSIPEQSGLVTELMDTDLSVIPNLNNRIFSLLSPEPLFHTGDFRKILADHYKRTTRVANHYERDMDSSSEAPINVRDFSTTRLVIGPNSEFLYAFGPEEGSRENDIDEWIKKLARLKPSVNQTSNIEEFRAVFWHMLYRLAMKLLIQQAFVPTVVTNTQHQTGVHWRPTLLDESVTSILKQFYITCPIDLVLYQSESTPNKTPSHYHLNQNLQVDCALNVILKYFTTSAFNKLSINLRQDKIRELFFTTYARNFDQFENSAAPKVIKLWLSRLSLRERKHRIYFVVELDQQHYESTDDLVTTDALLTLQIKIETQLDVFTIQEFADKFTTLDDYVSILSDLSLLAEYFPDIERLFQQAPTRKEIGIKYSLSEFTPVLLEQLPTLNMMGVQLVMPKSLKNILRPTLSLSAESASKNATSFLDLKKLVSFNWQIALGDQQMSPDEFMKLLEKASGLVLLKDQFVFIDGNEMKLMLKRLNNLPATISSQQLLTAHLTGELNGAQINLDNTVTQLIDGMLTVNPVRIPIDLHAELRPYQKRGFEWMVQNARVGFGSLLADDMGLGKTLQVITLLLKQKELGEFVNPGALVVVPTSLLTNWRKEIEKFAPGLSVRTYHGSQRDLSVVTEDVVLTSFGIVRSDINLLRKFKFRTLVVDEAQNIKNPGSQQTKAVKLINSEVRIGLTGTPVENKLMDYWSIFDFSNRGLLGTQTKFQKSIAAPIEKDRNSACLDKFRKLTGPFILRRMKSDKTIISDLPDKIVSDCYCTLTAEQASLYESTVNNILESLESATEGIERRGIIFKLISSLKQICNSPSHYLSRDNVNLNESGKLSLLVDIMREPLEMDEKILVFTQFVQMGNLLVKIMHSEFGMEVPFLHGGLTRKARDRLVDSFQDDHRTRVLVLSLKAGGTGLNLTAASQLVHYDLWWNPAVESQATDRAHRIGQTKNVIVHRLITENTLEEKINEMIQGKRELANLTVVSGEQALTELTNEQLRELVALS